MKIISLPFANPWTKFVRLGAIPHRVVHLWGQYYLAWARFDLLTQEIK